MISKPMQGVGGDAPLLSEIRQSVRESSNGKSSRVSSDLSKRNLFHLITFIINEVGRIKLQGRRVRSHGWRCIGFARLLVPFLLSRDLGTMLGCCLGVDKVHQFRFEDVLEVVAWLGGQGLEGLPRVCMGKSSLNGWRTQLLDRCSSSVRSKG